MDEDLPAAPTAAKDTESREAEGRRIAALLTRVGVGAWSIVGILVALWAVLVVLSRLEILLAPVVLAVALIFVLNPVVNHLSAMLRLHRVIATFVAFLLLIGVLVLLGFIVAPSITDQANELATDFPQIYEDTTIEIADLVEDIGFGRPDLWSYEELQDYLNDPEVRDRFFSAAVDRLGQLTSGLVEAILVFLVAPVVAFYVLIDLPRVRENTVSLIPAAHRPELLFLSRQLGHTVGGFLRGQVIVALIVGIMTSVGFYLIDLKFWLIIGLISGFLNIIPFVGPWVAGILGSVVGLVTADLETAVLAALVALIVQQIDNNFVSPTVLRATVRLHPAVVVLVLILGGGIGGFWGILLAVPVTAALKIIAGHLWRTRVLDESWEQARDALIEEQPEPLLARIRRGALGRRADAEDRGNDADDAAEPASADATLEE